MTLLWNQTLQEWRLYKHLHQGKWFHTSTPEDLKKYEPVIRQISGRPNYC